MKSPLSGPWSVIGGRFGLRLLLLVGVLWGSFNGPVALNAQQNKPWEKIPVPKTARLQASGAQAD